MLGRDLGCGKGKGWPQGRGWAAQTPTARVHGCGHPFGQGRPSDCIIPGWPSPSYRNPEEMNRMKSGEGTDTPTPQRLIKNHSTFGSGAGGHTIQDKSYSNTRMTWACGV